MILKPYAFSKVVAAAGTRERLVDSNLQAPVITLQAENSNTGTVYVGGETVSSSVGIELTAGDNITFNAIELGLANAIISFKDIWLDVSVSTDGVKAIYLERG